jgi:hypothetical protein
VRSFTHSGGAGTPLPFHKERLGPRVASSSGIDNAPNRGAVPFWREVVFRPTAAMRDDGRPAIPAPARPREKTDSHSCGMRTFCGCARYPPMPRILRGSKRKHTWEAHLTNFLAWPTRLLAT